MPYVRTRGNQLAIVHGEREPGTGKVQQHILFTIYSKPEALEILGRGTPKGAYQFQSLLQEQYPEIKFPWKQIERAVKENLSVLPETYDYGAERLRQHFRKDLCAFTRSLSEADPQELLSSAQLIQEHRHELEYLADLIHWRLKLREQEPSEFNADNAFHWRFTLQGRHVPWDREEDAEGFYERGEYEKARAVYRLLMDCFGEYAEGYNYLGLIAYQQRKLKEALGHFEKTMELGRKLFPARIARKHYWRDHKTRPYMRGLRNSVLTLNELGRFDDALALCERLERECADEYTALGFRAMIYLNTGQWEQAAQAASQAGGELNAAEGFVEGFARFELGETAQVLPSWLMAALHYPRAARMLVGLRTAEPKSAEEARDHNTGVYELRGLHRYLKNQPRRAKKFFRALMADPRVVRLLDEHEQVQRQWRESRDSTDRRPYERMMQMRSQEFASREAEKMRDLVSSKVSASVVH